MSQIDKLAYKEGYKYQVHEEFTTYTGITGFGVVLGHYLTLAPSGELRIGAGYAWDGASGPAFDTKNFIVPSLVHDALYQLIREDALPFSYRKHADDLLIKLCKDHGMWWPRRKWVYAAVRLAGANALEADNPVLFAPEKPW
jgi:hypothetical protein